MHAPPLNRSVRFDSEEGWEDELSAGLTQRLVRERTRPSLLHLMAQIPPADDVFSCSSQYTTNSCARWAGEQQVVLEYPLGKRGLLLALSVSSQPVHRRERRKLRWYQLHGFAYTAREDRAMETLLPGDDRASPQRVRSIPQAPGITREAAFLQQTPQGDMVVVYFEAQDIPHVFEGYASSQEPYDVWFREQIEGHPRR